MKTLQECLAFVRHLESRIPVNEWTVDGVHLWPLIRSLLYYRLTISLARPAGEARDGPSPLVRLVDAMIARFRDGRRNLPRVAPADVFVLTYAGARQARVDGEFVDVRVGPLIDHLASIGAGCTTWEYASPQTYRTPRRQPSRLVQREFFAAQIGNALLGRPRAELPGYSGFCDALYAQGALYPELLERSLLREIGLILRLRDRFEQAFDVIRPALALSSNAGRYEFALNLACARRRIPSVELQHGVQGPLHGQYAAWSKAPAEGYALLPQVYWCWDEESAAAINAWSGRCAPRHRAIVGGNPWLDACAGEATAAASGDRRRGLITLQPPGKVSADGRLVPEFVLDALSKRAAEWTWEVRVHPASPTDPGPLAAEMRRRSIEADFDRASVAPLPHLLRRAELHLTHSSSTVLEAGALGVRSVVWSDLGSELYASAIRAGTCGVARDAEALARELGRPAGGPRPERSVQGPGYRKVLEELLDQGRRATTRA